MSRRTNIALASGAAALVLAGFAATAPDARAARRSKAFQVGEFVVLPREEGAQPGDPLTVRFVLFGPAGRSVRLTLDYGVDSDADADLLIEKKEFRRATVSETDGRRPPLFAASPEGTIHQFTWRAAEDLPRQRHTFVQPIREDGAWLLADLPPGRPLGTGPGVGAALRLRAKRRLVALSPPFDIDTGRPPAFSIAYSSGGTFFYDAAHPDSEDVNGDGAFDPSAGEDLDHDSLFDIEHAQLRFWYAPMPDGVTQTDALTPEQVSALPWKICTRDASAGEPDRGIVISPIVRRHAFAWDHRADHVIPNHAYVIGGVAVDDEGRASDFTRMHDIVYFVQ